MNDYYDVSIKEWRLQEVKNAFLSTPNSTYIFYKDDLANTAVIDKIFEEHKPDIHRQSWCSGRVRYSISNPDAYIQSNMIGFITFLKPAVILYDNGAKGVEHLVYASSSSVYGTNNPYSTDDKVDNPVSPLCSYKEI